MYNSSTGKIIKIEICVIKEKLSGDMYCFNVYKANLKTSVIPNLSMDSTYFQWKF